MASKKAFTLVELIVTVSIIAIVATIGMSAMQSHFTNTRDSSRITELGNISIAIEKYKTKKRLPDPENAIAIKNGNTNIATQGSLSTKILEDIGYNKGGKDPKTDHYYTYYRTDNKKYYQVMTGLENKANLPKSEQNNKSIHTANLYPYTKGQKLGVLTNLENIPIEQEIQTEEIDISLQDEPLVAHLENFHFVSGTGVVLSGLEQTAKQGGKLCESNLNGTIECQSIADSRRPGTGIGKIDWSSAIWYNSLPTNVQDVFDNDLPYVEHWDNNQCIKENIEIININTSNYKTQLCNWNWNDTSCENYNEQQLLSNKIYIFEPGTYTFDRGLTVNRRYEGVDCNAIIGKKGETFFKSSSTTYAVVDTVSAGHIIYGVDIDGSVGADKTTGIKFSDKNITVMNVNIENTTVGMEGTDGNINSGNPGYLLGKNINITNSDKGIYIARENNFILSNTNIYNNNIGLHLVDTNTSISNANIFNNNEAIRFNGSDGVINNTNIFNNNTGIITAGANGGVIVNNLNIFDNSNGLVTLDAREIKTNNLHIHGNTQGMRNDNGTTTYFGYLNFYNNTNNYYLDTYNGFMNQGTGDILFSDGSITNGSNVGKLTVNMSGWSESSMGEGSFGVLNGFSFNSNVPKQTQPLKNTNTNPEYYGEDGGVMYDYDTSKYIGEW